MAVLLFVNTIVWKWCHGIWWSIRILSGQRRIITLRESILSASIKLHLLEFLGFLSILEILL